MLPKNNTTQQTHPSASGSEKFEKRAASILHGCQQTEGITETLVPGANFQNVLAIESTSKFVQPHRQTPPEENPDISSKSTRNEDYEKRMNGCMNVTPNISGSESLKPVDATVDKTARWPNRWPFVLLLHRSQQTEEIIEKSPVDTSTKSNVSLPETSSQRMTVKSPTTFIPPHRREPPKEIPEKYRHLSRQKPKTTQFKVLERKPLDAKNPKTKRETEIDKKEEKPMKIVKMIPPHRQFFSKNVVQHFYSFASPNLIESSSTSDNINNCVNSETEKIIKIEPPDVLDKEIKQVEHQVSIENF